MDGNPLQRLGHGNAPFDLVTLTVTAFQQQTVAVFGWVGDVGGSAGALASSFEAGPDDEQADALLRLLFIQVENLFLRQSWWEGLARPYQEMLVRQVMVGTPTRARTSNDFAQGTRLLTAGILETSSA